MGPRALTWPTLATRLPAARAQLWLADEVGLAVRADRLRLRLSQRTYAARRRLTLATVARLETGAGDLTLSTVVDALEGTEFVLCLCRRPDDSDSPGGAARGLAALQPARTQPEPLPPTAWPWSDPDIRATPPSWSAAFGRPAPDSAAS